MQTGLSSESVAPGFADPVFDAQRAFRAVLDAMARPGRIAHIDVALAPPAPLDPATAAVILALADYETPVWLDETAHSDETVAWLRFHCGCPLIEDSRRAAFAVALDAPPLARLDPGSDEFPEASTTLVLQVADLAAQGPLALTGPGIESVHRISVSGLFDGFWAERQAVNAAFPRGIDIILACGRHVCGLPRTTRVEG